MNILVVDDHPVGRRLLRAIFEAENMQVFEAGDGVEALATLAHDRVDAMVTDILMPRMDGYRLCYEVRADARWRDTPIIIYSATYTEQRDRQLAFELGADRFVHKPSPSLVLLSAVRECLGKPTGHVPPGPAPAGLTLMRNYSERLVAKLEERNVELEEARAELREANALLEWRVERRTEELAVANRQLDSFAAFVSHEVRAPLRTIHSYARQLAEEFGAALPPEARRLTTTMARAARHSERLTEALLEFCQLGAQPVRRCTVDLNAVVHAAFAALTAEAKDRAIDLVMSPLPPVDGDALLLEHLFRNLLANALKFTRPRPLARIEVGVRTGDGPTVFQVRDNGVGFEPRFATLVFEPFQQLHRDEGFEGSGLGLSLVRNIVTRHGGSIWAETAPDAGTTISFTLEGSPADGAGPLPLVPGS